MGDVNFIYYLEHMGITGQFTENTQIKTRNEIIQLKAALRLRFPVFMTGVC